MAAVDTASGLRANQSTTYTVSEVSQQISDVVGAAPAVLNALHDLAAALNSGSSFASTITNALAAKVPIANPTFTGTIRGINEAS